MRYLARSRGVADHWYPSDLRKRALVEKYLDSHHSGLRICVVGVVFNKFFGGSKNSDEDIQGFLDMEHKVFAQLEKMLENQDYLCGNEISIADLAAAMELEQC